MGDSCGGCRSREEEIFWTHFQCIHFSQFVRGNFRRRLEIPEKFAKNIKKKLPDTVTVKGPSGIIWDLGLTADGETLFFDSGWKNFALDHSLEENDLLIFKYNGLSHFDVLMFEGLSMCEKASSYFVRKCAHIESDTEQKRKPGKRFQSKRKIDENPDEIVHNPSQCGLESSPEKSTNGDINTIPSKEPINATPSFTIKRKHLATTKKTRRAGSSTRSAKRRGRVELCTFAGEVKSATEFDGTTMDEDGFFPSPSCYQEPLTQFEKEQAFLKAQDALTPDGFLVVMKPTHVWKRYYMAVPSAWMAKHNLRENTDIILRINERTWRTRYNYHKSRDCGGLSGGWKSFANDNNLVEHDACVFEPSDIERKPIVLDVHIFRVLEASGHQDPKANGEVQAPVPLTMRFATF